MTGCKNPWRRILELLGLILEEVTTPVTDPGSPTPEWCNHQWEGPYEQADSVTHTCDLDLGHSEAEHACGCGARLLTCQATRRILRIIKLPDTYDDCTWPEGGICPYHDKQQPRHPGRDCTGTCTNCNAPAFADHDPSCHHYHAEQDTRR